MRFRHHALDHLFGYRLHRLTPNVVRSLQDDELADVVEQPVHEGFLFVESGPLGDEARHVRRPDAVLEERLAAVTVDVPVLHPRVVANGHDEVANRRRAHGAAVSRAREVGD